MSIKEEVLRLLEKDKEFRYTVAGYIGLSEIMRRLEEHDRKFNEIVAKLEEHDRKFNEIALGLRDIRAYIERTSLTLEEEALEVISHMLKAKGIEIKLERLILPRLEIDVYGCSNGLCVVGEATTRLGLRLIDELERKVRELSSRYPENLRRELIKVIYTMWTTPKAVDEARRKDIWVVKTTAELTPMKKLRLRS